MATILHLGKSSLPKKPITDDDVDRISLCLKVLSECSPLMNDIFNKECRQSLSHMLSAKLEEEKLSQKVRYIYDKGIKSALCSLLLIFQFSCMRSVYVEGLQKAIFFSKLKRVGILFLQHRKNLKRGM